ncbi:kinase-like domain-containing protein [Gigaspora rosea]|uniref:Kinase-like domain-containing protein n=1 Tax=Gigaspora rosea TaxID=44941 RepID=A0A397UF21_9GLOM|nr:kinase-like domain-containing protein [Gigaspora rosea]
MSSNSGDDLIYEKCFVCKKPQTGDNWCRNCNSKHFKKKFCEWTSGNKVIDEFIQQIQLKAINNNQVLEWIPFEDITDIKNLAVGGYGIVYKAVWTRSPIEYYDNDAQEWHRLRSEKTDIVLKSISNSNNINIPDEFFEEIKAQMTSFVDFGYTIRCFGVTKCPTSNYMMIMEYKKDGGLHEYLDKNFRLLTWEQKLDILYTAIKGLSKIHKAKLIHKDFHAGNIIIDNNISYIADFGLCKRVNSEDKSKNGGSEGIYGVLPYVDPEVLRTKTYTQAADIYSFGVVMNQVAVGYRPFHETKHDTGLVHQIVNQERRPSRNEDITPQFITDLIKSCWEDNPDDRPKAIELVVKLSSYRNKGHEIWTQIKVIEEKMDLNIPPEKAGLNYEKSLEPSFYTSKLINELCK